MCTQTLMVQVLPTNRAKGTRTHSRGASKPLVITSCSTAAKSKGANSGSRVSSVALASAGTKTIAAVMRAIVATFWIPLRTSCAFEHSQTLTNDTKTTVVRVLSGSRAKSVTTEMIVATSQLLVVSASNVTTTKPISTVQARPTVKANMCIITAQATEGDNQCSQSGSVNIDCII